MELLNETFITMATQWLVLFTEFVPNASDRARCGWIFVAILAFQITINFCFILQEIIRAVILFIKRWYIRFTHCLKPKEKSNNEVLIPDPIHIQPPVLNTIELS